MLILLLISITTLAFNIQPVKASGTIYIRADGSIDVPVRENYNNLAEFSSAYYSFSASSEPPAIEWNKTYSGGTAYSIQQTSDGGYVFAGGWLVKVDAEGNVQWNKTYDGSARSVQQTADGGYIICGSIPQKDYEYYSDGWFAKIDSAGNLEWNKTYGGERSEAAYSVKQTSDGGYIFAGYKNEFIPMDQVWLVKTDASGNQEWTRTFGGDGWNEMAFSVVETSDGGYATVGWTYSFGAGETDAWLIKTDSAGNMEWHKTYGGIRWDGAFSIQQTGEGGYIIAGKTYSFGSGAGDAWLIKTDAAGNVQWHKTYTGGDADCVHQTIDGGYIFAGGWLVRTDSTGTMEWNKTYGGYAQCVRQTADRGYIVAGYAAGGAWLMKLVPEVVSPTRVIYIRADGTIDPPDAAISSDDNVTYTFVGNISDPIIVERNDIVIDGAGYTVQGTGSGNGIDLSNRNNVTFKNANLQCFEKGIYLKNSSFCVIANCNITNNLDGVTVESIEEVVIEKSEIISNSENGITIIGKGNVVVRENSIKKNKNGIATDTLDIHSGIVITNNTITSNQQKGIYVYSYGYAYGVAYLYNVAVSYNNISFNGGDGVYLYGYGYAPENGYSYSYMYNITISNNTFSYNGENGIHLYSCATGSSYIYDIVISSNNISSNEGNGIYIYSYGYNGYKIEGYYYGYGYIYDVVVSFNTVFSNSEKGIYIYSYGDKGYPSDYPGGYGYGYIYNLVILSNAVLFNGDGGIHLYCRGRGYQPYAYHQGQGCIYALRISSNNISSNNGNGIHLHSYGSNGYGHGFIYNVTTSFNIICSNTFSGIHMTASDHYSGSMYDLEMLENTISANLQKGIWIDGGINANLTCNSISYNMYGVFYVKTINNLANYNDIYRNSYGMNVTGGATVNAENNYWGDASGPYHESLNTNGKGNSVNGNGVDLDFIPFLTAPIGRINERPLAALLADKTLVEINQTVTFDASASTDDGRIEYYFFDFGDGTNSGWTSLPIVTHEYTSEGIYNVTVIVMDNFGVTSLDSNLVYVTITVIPEFPPTIILPLFMVLSIIALAFANKKRKKQDPTAKTPFL